MSKWFYNTNGFAFHRLEDAVTILSDIGYDGVAWTPDVHHLDPLRCSPGDVRAFRRLLERRGLDVIVETGARFVLDPRRKHRPSLLDDPSEAARRLFFLRRCVDWAAEVGAGVVSTWSGAAPAEAEDEAGMERLASALRELCVHGASRGVRIGFEPEPGMAVERAAAWPEVRDRVGHEALGLTLDVGHCLATGEGDPAEILRRHARDLVVVHLDDHRRGVHEHLAFGEGEIDFASVAASLADSGYDGPLEVELSRHSAAAVGTATASFEFLQKVFARRSP